MTDIEDILQRSKELMEKCRCEKVQRENAQLVDKVFREPKRQAEQKALQEKEEAKRQKQLEERWKPYLEKAIQHSEQKRKEYDDKIVNAVRR